MSNFLWTPLTVKSIFFQNSPSKWVLVFCVVISASMHLPPFTVPPSLSSHISLVAAIRENTSRSSPPRGIKRKKTQREKGNQMDKSNTGQRKRDLNLGLNELGGVCTLLKPPRPSTRATRPRPSWLCSTWQSTWSTSWRPRPGSTTSACSQGERMAPNNSENRKSWLMGENECRHVILHLTE